eukprot:CAMPEP_0202850778 /NCGR_PEP_ID=MMETSP1389-20130828/84564_1 /ASSEMBLY_ACC=CAM_ASM_000865 /TAXON_ID=302021 /ORGANISM="Rhodomonas sp., Strain CCMP768" /LENGTH=58 /DNA_ID=CAMNT_0049529003 /DNA_START=39 /DNA_END=212 /DNA_ORIENTATION=-
MAIGFCFRPESSTEFSDPLSMSSRQDFAWNRCRACQRRLARAWLHLLPILNRGAGRCH